MHVAAEFSVEQLIHANNLVCLWNWKQLQGDPVQHGKNPRIHSDSQRGCEHRHRREPRILRQCPRSISQIAPSGFQRHEAPRSATSFLDAHQIPKLPPRRVARFVCGNSPLAVLLLAHRQMKRQFIPQVPIQLLPLEQRLHSHPVAHIHFSAIVSARASFPSPESLFPTPFASLSRLRRTCAANIQLLPPISCAPPPSASNTSRAGCFLMRPTPRPAAPSVPTGEAQGRAHLLPRATRRSSSHGSTPPPHTRA